MSRPDFDNIKVPLMWWVLRVCERVNPDLMTDLGHWDAFDGVAVEYPAAVQPRKWPSCGPRGATPGILRSRNGMEAGLGFGLSAAGEAPVAILVS